MWDNKCVTAISVNFLECVECIFGSVRNSAATLASQTNPPGNILIMVHTDLCSQLEFQQFHSQQGEVAAMGAFASTYHKVAPPGLVLYLSTF